MKTIRIFNSSPALCRSFFILFLLIGFSTKIKATDYYWVGNGGNWSSLSHWATTSGGTTLHTQLPGATDDVFFDVNSFSLPGQTIQLNQAPCITHDMNWIGVLNIPIMTGAYPNSLKIYGSLTITSPVNFTAVTCPIYFSSTTTGETVTSSGNILSIGMVFDGIGGEWTLLDALNARAISLRAGTLNTNDNAVTAEVFSSGSQPNDIRVLNMGNSVFTLTGTSAWYVQDDGVTINGANAVINCIAAGARFYHYVNAPVCTYNNVNFTSNSAIQANMESSNAIIHNVDFAGNAKLYGSNYQNVIFHDNGAIPYLTVVDNITFTPGKKYQITSGLTINGIANINGTCDAFIDINLGAPGSQAYGAITSTGNINISHVRMSYMKGLGGGTFTATDSYNHGANTGWTFTSASLNKYWVGNGGNWSDPNHWSLSSGGTPGSCPPFATDNIFFDENSFSAPGQVVTADMKEHFFKDMYWTNPLNTPSFNLPDTAEMLVYGSLSFSTAMNSYIGGDVSFYAANAGNIIHTGGQVFRHRIMVWGYGEWTLMDDLNSISTIAQDAGTINTNGKTVAAKEFWLFNGILNMGSSVFNMFGKAAFAAFTGTIINPGTSVINCTADTARVANLGSPGQTLAAHRYYDVNFTGQNIGSISGPDSFHNVTYYTDKGYIGGFCDFNKAIFHGDGYLQKQNSYDSLYFSPAHTYTLGDGWAQRIRKYWRPLGTCTDSITIHTTIAGSPAFVDHQTDSVIGNYLKMNDIHGAGGAVFKAYNSTDLGGNTGWLFTSSPPMGNPGLINGNTTVCFGANPVSFYINPVAGAMSYQWTVPAGANIVSGQGDTLIVVDFGTATTGSIAVQAFDGCNFSANNSNISITIELPPTPAITLTMNPATAVCAGAPVTFTATAAGSGSGILTYNFKVNGISVQDGNSNSFTSTSLSDGDMITCTLTVSGSACFAPIAVVSDPITITVLPLFTPAVTISASPSTTICPATVAGFTASATGIGTGTVNYDFEVNGNSVQNSSSAIFSSAVSDNDVISCLITVSGTSCYTTTTALSNAVIMHVDPTAVTLNVQAGSDVSITAGQSIQLSANANPGTYLWTPATGLNAVNVLNPIALPTVTTVYTLTVTSAEGCIGTDEVKVEIKNPVTDDCKITEMNAITPNGDGINDKWIAWQGNCFSQVRVIVLNRYGTIVFQSENYHNDWQGTYKGKPLPDGTYYSIIFYKAGNAQQVEKKNDLTILR